MAPTKQQQTDLQLLESLGFTTTIQEATGPNTPGTPLVDQDKRLLDAIARTIIPTFRFGTTSQYKDIPASAIETSKLRAVVAYYRESLSEAKIVVNADFNHAEQAGERFLTIRKVKNGPIRLEPFRRRNARGKGKGKGKASA